MKKIFYSFAILSLVFTSCNPMEDIYKEVDDRDLIVCGGAKFTLSVGDYEDRKVNF